MLELADATAKLQQVLRFYEEIWKTPVHIVEHKTQEHEWGWRIRIEAVDPSLVSKELEPFPFRSFLVDRVTGFLQQVGTSGTTLALLSLMERRKGIGMQEVPPANG